MVRLSWKGEKEMRGTSYGMLTVFLMALIVLMNVSVIAQTQAKDLKNPVAADDASVSAGQKVFVRVCAMCHGQTGKGDGPVVKALKPEATKPSDLTDDKWDHGSTDGEMFVAIRDGNGAMAGQQNRVSDQDIWHVVNYIRNLGSPKK